MAIDPRISLGVQPLQVQSPMQGAQQFLTLRDLMASAQARGAQRDAYRQRQQIEAQQQQAQGQFLSAWQQSGGKMTPALASMGIAAGFGPEQMQQLSGVSNWGRPEVKQWIDVAGADGPQKIGVDAYGNRVGGGFSAPVELSPQNLGGEVGFFNKYTGAEGAPRVAKSPEQTEVERLMIASGIKPGSAQWNSTISGVLHKKTTHAPAANTTVYTGTMVPAEVGGKPAFVMPAKDGTYVVAPGVQPPGTAAAEDKRTSRLSAEVRKADTVLAQVDAALKNTGFGKTGLPGAVVGMVPGSDAYDLRATIDTLKANLSFDQIAEMRANSPTGGALGSVSDNELKLLGAAIASLDANQSNDRVKAGLEAVQRHYTNWRKAALESLGQSGPAPTEPAPPSAPSAPRLRFNPATGQLEPVQQ